MMMWIAKSEKKKVLVLKTIVHSLEQIILI